MWRSACILLTLSSGSLAQTSAPSTPPDDAIVVQARGGDMTRAYLDRVARPEPGRQLARWNVPLCIAYDGLDASVARFIQARIAETAGKVGLAMARGRCPTAVIVKLSDRADALTRELMRTNPPRLGSGTNRMPISKRTIDALEAPRTVRWLTASATVTADGVDIEASANRVWSASLIRSPTREDLHSKIILVDALRLADVTLNQLADYLAFVTLASPDIAAEFAGTDSIMALFAGAGFAGSNTAPARMTRQDTAFVEALYAIPADRPAAVQQGAIGIRMTPR